MRCMQYVFLLLLFVLSVLLAGCDFRDILDDYPVSGVKIKFNWRQADQYAVENLKDEELSYYYDVTD